MAIDPIETEAKRLAGQRQDDLDALHERERAREYERGRKDAADAAHTAEQDRRLDVINGSVEKTATAVEDLTKEVRAIKETQQQRDAINLALIESGTSRGTQKLTRIQTMVIVSAVIIALATFVLAVFQAVAHG